MSEQKIQELAYALWEEAGKPEGRQDEFWALAEERLRASHKDVHSKNVDETSEHSFPASDPANNT